MQESARRASEYETAVLNLVEADRSSRTTSARSSTRSWSRSTRTATRGDVVVESPAVEAPVASERELPLGTEVTVRLVEADPDRRTVRFELA